MSNRAKPRQHLAAMLAWAGAAAAGLWPALPGMGTVAGEPIGFLELVRYSNGVLGLVAVVGLGGLLAAVLHLLTALDLWLDARALRRGTAPGAWRAVRLGVPVALALALLVGGSGWGFYNLRKDPGGTYAALLDGHAARALEAWPRFQARFEAMLPSDQVPLPPAGADPVPTLRAMQRTPAADVVYHVAPDGWLTALDARGAVHRFHMPSWRPPQGRPYWPQQGPRPRRGPDGEPMAWFAQAVGEAHAAFNSYGSDRARADFHPLHPSDGGEVLYAKGGRKRGYLGFRLDEGALAGAEDILDGLGLPGRWALRSPYAEDVVPRPEDLGEKLMPVVLDLHLSRRTDEAHVQGVITGLAGLAVAFLAAVIEAVRQFRALIAERAMAMAQSSFVSGVSHEMRTPLATVRLYAELLEQRLDRDPAQRAEFVGAILHEVDRLHRLIENVLDFARISGRKRTYAFVPTDLRALVDEAVQAASGPLTAAGMAVEVHAPAEVTAAVDRDAVVHALTNLLTNAAKYAAEGGRVWVSALPSPGGATLAVQDFGPGIAKEDRAVVFRPFHRLPGTAAGGSGLGLALVREYAQAHGGGVELESALGKGSTFKIHLPLDPAEAPVLRRELPWRGVFAAIRRRNAA